MDTLDYKEPITKIYFVRHGETKANVKQLLFGHLDWDLTVKGLLQAKETALKLTKTLIKPMNRRDGETARRRKEKIDYIISSPLKRAKHTAKIIAKYLPAKKIIIDKNLIEKSEGIWEGKDFWDVRKNDSKNYYKWLKNPFKNKPPKGESVSDMDKRVKKFYKTVLKKYPGKNIIVVSHSGPIRLFILNVLKTNINKFWHLKVGCGSITEVHISKKHSMVYKVNT